MVFRASLVAIPLFFLLACRRTPQCFHYRQRIYRTFLKHQKRKRKQTCQNDAWLFYFSLFVVLAPSHFRLWPNTGSLSKMQCYILKLGVRVKVCSFLVSVLLDCSPGKGNGICSLLLCCANNSTPRLKAS